MAFRTLIHIRHGETFWNAERRLQGGRDIDLNPRGRLQAAANGLKLAGELARLGIAPDAVGWYASPLTRARDTMRAVRLGCGLPAEGYTLVTELKEISYGVYEGMTHEEIAAAAPADYRRLIEDKWGFKPERGESYYELRDRVAAVLDGLSGDVVIVSHGGVIRVIRSILEQRDDQELIEGIVPQDHLFVWRDGRGSWV
jgi:probable phosphoglycerate mutase